MRTERELFKALFLGGKTPRFALGVIFGLSFSVACILCTVGIMDGFDYNMRESLKSIGGHGTISSRDGFFDVDDEFFSLVRTEGVVEANRFVQTQGFLIFQGKASAVVVKGVESFEKESLSAKDVVIGESIARYLDVKKGDEITLALANGNKQLRERPKLISFTVSKIYPFKLHEHDRRFLFVNLAELQDQMNLNQRVNLVEIKYPKGIKNEDLESRMESLRLVLGQGYRVTPYDAEFSFLLESVEKEKVIIGLILQIIVVIAVFNVLAFVIFLNDRKAKEIFLFKSLGLSQKSLNSIWIKAFFCLWVASCLLSLVLVEFFDWSLQNLDIFKLPGDVYHLNRLSLELEVGDYLFVFILCLAWLLLLTWFTLRKMRKLPLLYGLRKEFQ